MTCIDHVIVRQWLLEPLLEVVGIIAIVIGLGVYFATSRVPPYAYYWFPFPFFPLGRRLR